jgi:DUF438 domain-containing protein
MSEFLANRTERAETLKSILRRLHAGEAPAEVKATMRKLVQEVDACELMAAEQQLIAEGMPVRELQGMCDLHSQVARETLTHIAPAVAPGHPVDQFRQENQALREVIARMRTASDLFAIRQAYNDLNDIDKHYQRKEHLVFSCLERHGITGPSTVMWGKDDEVRAMLKELGRGLRNGEYDRALAEKALASIEEMMFKEENILLPMCQQKLSEEEWAEIWASAPRYGWCLVPPREGYRPPASYQPKAASNGGVQLPTGHLTIDQLTTMFSHLPVDITFVDANDRVAFFSEGPDRVFARSRAIIGRKVQHCHPPKSVDTVNQILEDFRAGRQNVAEFWLEFHGRFVHVRYFAVRDAAGAYMGTLEVTQDATKIRALTGERRLLQYDVAPAGVA